MDPDTLVLSVLFTRLVKVSMVGDDPSGPTGASVRKGVPDSGVAAQREIFEHLKGLDAIF